MMKKLLQLFALLIVSSPFYAQLKVWTLEECIQHALENNVRINNQKAQNKIYDQNYREAIAQLLPGIEAGTDVDFKFGRGVDSETNLYTDINTFSNNYGISAGIVLFDGLAGWNRARMQKVIRLMGRHQLQETRDLLAYETIESYFNVLYYAEMIKLAEEQQQESNRNLERSRRMEELGMTSYPDVVELAAKEAADAYNLTRQKNLHKIAIIRLKEKMYFPIDEELEIAEYTTPGVIVPTDESPLAIYEQSAGFLPTTQAAETYLRSQQLYYNAAKGSLLPVISINGSITTNFSRFMNGNEYIPFAEQFRNKRGYYIGISLSIPIFDRLARISEVKRSKQQVVMAQNRKQETMRTLYSEIEQAVADMNGQADEFRQAERQEEAMKLAHQLNLRKYEEGLLSALELHTSSNRLMQARTEKLGARLRYNLKERLVNYYRVMSFEF